MKRILLFVAIIFHIINLFSQESFVKVIKNEKSILANNLIQLDDDSYIVGGFSAVYYRNTTTADSIVPIIYKLDNFGEILSVYSDVKLDTFWAVRDILILDNNHFISYETIAPEEESIAYYIYLTEFDYNLNIIERKKYEFPSDSLFTAWSFLRRY